MLSFKAINQHFNDGIHLLELERVIALIILCKPQMVILRCSNKEKRAAHPFRVEAMFCQQHLIECLAELIARLSRPTCVQSQTSCSNNARDHDALDFTDLADLHVDNFAHHDDRCVVVNNILKEGKTIVLTQRHARFD